MAKYIYPDFPWLGVVPEFESFTLVAGDGDNDITILPRQVVKEDPLIEKFIELDLKKPEIKAYYDELDAVIEGLVDAYGVDVMWQDEDGIVYKIDTCNWKNVKMTPFKIARTRREGERQGDLSMKEARDAGFVVEGK